MGIFPIPPQPGDPAGESFKASVTESVAGSVPAELVGSLRELAEPWGGFSGRYIHGGINL